MSEADAKAYLRSEKRVEPEDGSAGSLERVVSLRPETCSWHRWESGQYETSCDNVFEFTNDGIKENDFKHCPFCGGSIQEKQANNVSTTPVR